MLVGFKDIEAGPERANWRSCIGDAKIFVEDFALVSSSLNTLHQTILCLNHLGSRLNIASILSILSTSSILNTPRLCVSPFLLCLTKH